MPGCPADLSPSDVVSGVRTFFMDTWMGKGVIGLGVVVVAFQVTSSVKRRLRRGQWRKRSKDVVILHQFHRGKLSPNISPFCLKLETYLRMARIPYEVDYRDMTGPKGKTPYLTVDGREVADSEFCIEYLGRKYGKDMSGHLTPEQLAAGHALQVMVDEHLFWGLAMWRVFFSNGECISKIQHFPWYLNDLVKYLIAKNVKKMAKAQGIYVHSEEEVEGMVMRDLKAISTLVGRKQFMFGDEPCEVDCAVFSELVQALWNSPGSNIVKTCDAEMPNLREYCQRMKQRYWQDWDKCLYKGY